MTVVFLHSFGGSAKNWDLILPYLSIPVIAPNLRGFGGSPAPEGVYDVDSYVEDVLALTSSLDEFSIVGHSMGGKFALGVAARQPKGLKSLLLIAPSPPIPEPMTDEGRRELLDGYGSRRVAEKTVAGIVKCPISADVREVAVDGYLASSERAWRAWLEIGSKEDISSFMSRIDVPVTILAGTRDPILGPDVQRRTTVPYLSHAELVEVAGSGHLMPIEAPEQVLVHVVQLLEENATAIRR